MRLAFVRAFSAALLVSALAACSTTTSSLLPTAAPHDAAGSARRAAQVTPDGRGPALPPLIAQTGVELPTMGAIFPNLTWNYTYTNYFSPAVMSDIKTNLQATYIRTGWVPLWEEAEATPWANEDVTMDDACQAGLSVMVIIPQPSYASSWTDLLNSVNAFFGRYTQREVGCLMWAEVWNEANDLSGMTASTYATDYEAIAPIVNAYGVQLITSGVSYPTVAGFESWTSTVEQAITAAGSPVRGYGVHPYNFAPTSMATVVADVASAAATTDRFVWVTEIGEDLSDDSNAAADLTTLINNLAQATPSITIYEYKSQPGESTTGWGLVDNPTMYAAVASAFGTIATLRSGTRSPSIVPATTTKASSVIIEH